MFAWGSCLLALLKGTGPAGLRPRQAGMAIVFRSKALLLYSAVWCRCANLFL